MQIHKVYKFRIYPNDKQRKIDSMSLRCTLFDLEDAYQGFFKK